MLGRTNRAWDLLKFLQTLSAAGSIVSTKLDCERFQTITWQKKRKVLQTELSVSSTNDANQAVVETREEAKIALLV